MRSHRQGLAVGSGFSTPKSFRWIQQCCSTAVENVLNLDLDVQTIDLVPTHDLTPYQIRRAASNGGPDPCFWHRA